MYKALIQPVGPFNNSKKNGKIKTPLKIKFFGWYLHRGLIPIKYNLAKQN
jgi:hypothetical protein